MRFQITDQRTRYLPLSRWMVPALLSVLAAQAIADPRSEELKRIDALIGRASCTSDQQCHVAAVGQRSCGGPELFRAWSRRETRPAALDQALKAYEQARRREQLQSGEMSTCELLPVPTSVCTPSASGAGLGRCSLSAASEIR